MPAIDARLVGTNPDGGGRWALAREKPEKLSLLAFYRGIFCPICRTWVADLDRRVRQLTPPGASGRHTNDRGAPLALREAGAQLLARSADVTVDDEAHPAFARILA